MGMRMWNSKLYFIIQLPSHILLIWSIWDTSHTDEVRRRKGLGGRGGLERALQYKSYAVFQIHGHILLTWTLFRSNNKKKMIGQGQGEDEREFEIPNHMLIYHIHKQIFITVEIIHTLPNISLHLFCNWYFEHTYNASTGSLFTGT